ncbi:hypothetical protein B0H12DRAFT_1094607 [Mycena haematopus]|nr:hypothetical protein B0H12DRAFT_1094607 [Mycena haematopus]
MPAEVIRRVDLLNEAGPSNNEAGPSNLGQICTPIRKTVSMGPYPTPDSLPRRHGVPQSSPPSPSPRGSFAMDVDHESEPLLQPIIYGQTAAQGASAAFPTPSPSDTETELATTKAQLRQAQDKIARYRTELGREKARHAPRYLKLQKRIAKLKDRVCELKAEMAETEKKQSHWFGNASKLAVELAKLAAGVTE